MKKAPERFFDNLASIIEHGERQTHIRHDGDRHSRLIKMSIREDEVEEVLQAIRQYQQLTEKT